ncbi:MAG: DUF2807 domain-containing protein [Cyclobacteriaceae bacterium]|nr:DUF2807 domain-containing protein [Cyclobacteriaceae bacterium]
MKKVFVILFVLGSTFAFAQSRETRNVETFNKIAFGLPGKAIVTQGSPQKVELEGSKEMLERADVYVEGSKLVIRSKDRWRSWSRDERITVYITVKDINALSVSGSGTLEAITKIITGNLDLKVSGSGSLRADVDANNVDASVSGSGSVVLRGKCNNLESNISGSGDVEATVAIANTLDVSISGSGKLVASGSANTVKTTISGSGRVRAADLEANKCDVKIAGSGSVEINVKRELNANISGSGSVNYKGNPNHVNTNSSGSGKVRKVS